MIKGSAGNVCVRADWAAAIPVLLFSLAASLMTFFNSAIAAKDYCEALTFAERVSYQRAIEEVYWRHRIWPKDNPRPKPALEVVISERALEQKVEVYLHKSQLVADHRGQAMTVRELQAEMERIASHTKQADVLRELFAALGNDAFVIAECLARPVLAERTLATVASLNEPLESWRARAESQTREAMPVVTGNYALPQISAGTGGCIDDTWTATSTVNPPDARDGHTAVWTGSEMIIWGGYNNGNDLNSGGRYNPATDSWTPTSTANAPAARESHIAVWTGSEMIVWGGLGCGSNCRLNTGGRYNPNTNNWVATST